MPGHTKATVSRNTGNAVFNWGAIPLILKIARRRPPGRTPPVFLLFDDLFILCIIDLSVIK